MNISTIEQGEELLKKVSNEVWNWDANNPQHQLLAFLINHASELLQMAREVESLRKENAHIKNFQYDEKGRIMRIEIDCGLGVVACVFMVALAYVLTR